MGNARIRALAVELTWSWVRRQPMSALTCWYREWFAAGGSLTPQPAVGPRLASL